ncbi:ParA family protein (plasmid) [Synechococcus elongatus IITB7]|uniref:ParA family protein n=1 Tax=Synechococcus elongatus TaxID=32046 RepID=UPI0030CB4636
MQTIAIAGRKGGVGKTSLTVALASYCTNLGLKTLVVDLDPQSNAGYCLGVEDLSHSGTAHLLLRQSFLPQQVRDNLWVLTGGIELEGGAIQQLDADELALSLQNIEADVVLFDCPPGQETLERFALMAANQALLCTDSHPQARLGIARLVNYLERRRQTQRHYPRWAIAARIADRRRLADRSLVTDLQADYPSTPVFEIPSDSDLFYATANGIPLLEAAPKARICIALSSIWKWTHE